MENLAKNGTFGPDPSEVKQPASALLWAYYYAAQHFDYKKDTDRALQYIDAAIDHTPTLIELFIVKGRIYKVSIYIPNLLHSRVQKILVLDGIVHFPQNIFFNYVLAAHSGFVRLGVYNLY